jgi:hypothetical protein
MLAPTTPGAVVIPADQKMPRQQPGKAKRRH